MPRGEPIELVIDEGQTGQRLDVVLAEAFADFSRAHLRKIIDAGGVTIDGKAAKPSHRVHAGDRVVLETPEIPREGPTPEDIPLNVLFEDEHLAAINKPPGMVVHPSKGHSTGTLVAALAHRFESLSSTGGALRPGIVHRLDRDTSGVIVVAKTDFAHMQLAAQFEARTTEKEYTAIVLHTPDRDRDVIDQPIGMHPTVREKMAIRTDHVTSRAAETYYEVVERFRGFTHLRVLPKTGRTHQIRVHLAHIGCPVLCDRHYGGKSQVTRGELRGGPPEGDVMLARQALHARRLKIHHPVTDQEIEFIADVPEDIRLLLDELRSPVTSVRSNQSKT